MPYIKQSKRIDVNELFSGYSIDDPGELNYIITCIINKYIDIYFL